MATAFPIPTQPQATTITPFVVANRWTWIDCDLDDYAGFRIEVRLNLTNGERQQLNLMLDDVEAERQRISERAQARIAPLIEAREVEGADRVALAGEIATVLEAAQAEHKTNNDRLWSLIAPHIRAWNIGVPDDEGNVIDAPPPAVAGAAAFDAVDANMSGWIVKAALEAYRGGKGWTNSPKTPGESGRPTNGRSRKGSSSRPSAVN